LGEWRPFLQGVVMRVIGFGVMAALAMGMLCAGCGRSNAEAEAKAKADAERARVLAMLMEESAKSNKVEADGSKTGGAAGGAAVVAGDVGGGFVGERGGVAAKAEPVRRVVEAPAGKAVPVVMWDFSGERAAKKIGWPSDTKNDYYTMEGDFRLQLKVKDGKDLDIHARQVNARKKSELVYGLEITTGADTTEEAYKNAKDLVGSLGLSDGEMSKLEGWYDKAKAGNFDNLELRGENSYGRVYKVRLINDGNSEKPWSTGVDVEWDNVCGCHG
jgi:hypothetical protein